MKLLIRFISASALTMFTLGFYASDSGSDLCSTYGSTEQKDTITAYEAEFMAMDLMDQFIILSRLTGPEGEDYSKKFIALFSMNASIPLDFYEGERSKYGSPETYVSEYVASGINESLSVTSKIIPKHTSVEEIQGSSDYSVTMFLERFKTKTTVDGEYQQLEKPIKETWKLVITAYSYGIAQISQVTRLAIPTITPLALDLSMEFNLANAQISEGASIGTIIGLDKMKVSSNNFSLGLNYRFLPFRNATSEEAITYYMKARFGLDFTSYTTEALDLSTEIPDYLTNDGVYLLINAPDSLNDSPLAEGSGDFILYIEDEFEEEKLKVTTLDLMIGGGYQFNENMALELGLGLVTSASGEIAVKSDYARYARFSEGYFEENPVTIYPGSASFALQSEVLSFDDQGEAYGLNSAAGDVNYKAETNSAMYLELKLIRLFDVGDFALGGTLSMRTLLGSPLSNDFQGTENLKDVALNGVPRLIAFTEKFNPLYVGIGLRIQKR